MTQEKLLENAVDFMRETFKDDDIFCTTLIDSNEKENKICAETCNGVKDDCVLRYLKYYKKAKKQ